MSRRTAQRRTKKEVSNFDKFVTEGNEKADELAKVRGMLDERFMAEARAETIQQERERRGVFSLAVRSKLSLFGGRMEGLGRVQVRAKRKIHFRG